MMQKTADTMRKAIVAGRKDVQIVETPVPDPGSNEIVVRTTLSGMSVGTEMALYRGTICNLSNGRWNYWNNYPVDQGCELAGIVEKKGANVDDVKEGDRVVSMSPVDARTLI